MDLSRRHFLVILSAVATISRIVTETPAAQAIAATRSATDASDAPAAPLPGYAGIVGVL